LHILPHHLASPPSKTNWPTLFTLNQELQLSTTHLSAINKMKTEKKIKYYHTNHFSKFTSHLPELLTKETLFRQHRQVQMFYPAAHQDKAKVNLSASWQQVWIQWMQNYLQR
jgi:hypothetical protein